MSALELYTLSPYAEYSYTPFFLTISIIAFASLIQIHLMYTAEIDKYSVPFDKRLAALESVTKDLATKGGARDKLLEEHSELHRNNIALHEQFEKSIMLRLAALEGVAKDLATTDSAHDKLLEEHGEEISLAAETAYRAAGLPDTNHPHPRGRSVPFHPCIQYAVDEPIQKFLRTSPKKTVREILSHLSHDEVAQTEWKRSDTREMTRHDVNSRLYSLLAQGKLKKDNGARVVWSVI
jgi:hypothetical protein